MTHKSVPWRIVLLIVGILVCAVFVLWLFFVRQGSGGVSQSSETFPTDGTRTITPPKNQPNPSEQSGQTKPAAPSTLFAVHDKPVVSSVIFTRAGLKYARFIEQGSGHVYEYDLKGRRGYRISNTSIPQIAEAAWSWDGTVVAFRYEDSGTLKAAVGELSTSTTESTFKKISFLPEGIRSLALSPNGGQVFYLVSGNTAGEAAGFIAARDGSSPKLVFSSKLPRWFASWPAQNTILLASPESEVGGVVYRIDPQTGTASTLYTNEGRFIHAQGAPSGQVLAFDPSISRSALYAGNRFEGLKVLAYPSVCAFAPTTTKTVAVCAQIPQQAVPLFSEWDRGEYDFATTLVTANFSEGYLQYPLTTEDTGDRLFDMVNIAVADNGTYTVFKNRVDGLLWGVESVLGF